MMKQVPVTRRLGFLRIDRRHASFIAIAALTIFLRVSSPTGSFASYMIVAAYAATGSRQSLEAFLLSWFLTMINPAIAPVAQFSEIGRYLVVFSAAGSHLLRSIAGKRPFKIYNSTLVVTVLGLLMLLHAAFLSEMPTISILKSTVWLLVVATIVAAINRLDDEEIVIATQSIYGFLVLVVYLGIVLLPTGAGFFRNGAGFQGFLNHPQILGTVAAILATRYLAIEMKRPGFSVMNAASILLLLYIVLLSQTRTALLAVSLSVAIATFVMLYRARRARYEMAGLFSAKALLFMAALPLVIILGWSSLSAAIVSFMAKTTNAEQISLLSQYVTSRGFLLDRMIENIHTDPLSGIGFGVPSVETTTQPTQDPIFGMPISLPVEKGNAFLAIIEETGVLLGGALVLWIGLRAVLSVRYGLSAIMVASTCLAINLGEAVFFSPGGQGILILVLFFLSTQRKVPV